VRGKKNPFGEFLFLTKQTQGKQQTMFLLKTDESKMKMKKK